MSLNINIPINSALNIRAYRHHRLKKKSSWSNIVLFFFFCFVFVLFCFFVLFLFFCTIYQCKKLIVSWQACDFSTRLQWPLMHQHMSWCLWKSDFIVYRISTDGYTPCLIMGRTWSNSKIINFSGSQCLYVNSATIFWAQTRCLWNTINPGDNKVQNGYQNVKIKVKVTKLSTLVSFKRASLQWWWPTYMLKIARRGLVGDF